MNDISARIIQGQKINGKISRSGGNGGNAAREGVVTLIVLGTTYAPSGIVNNIEEETVNEY